MNKILKDTIKGFVWGIVICLLIWLCSGCTTTKYVSVPEYHEVIKYSTDTLHTRDSIHVRDSVYYIIKGDSVFVNKWQTKYIERLKYISKTDTICRTDSISVPVYVEKSLTWYQRFRMGLLNWLLAIIAAFLGLYALIMKK